MVDHGHPADSLSLAARVVCRLGVEVGKRLAVRIDSHIRERKTNWPPYAAQKLALTFHGFGIASPVSTRWGHELEQYAVCLLATQGYPHGSAARFEPG